MDEEPIKTALLSEDGVGGVCQKTSTASIK
jgi:hypothetical protein